MSQKRTILFLAVILFAVLAGLWSFTSMIKRVDIEPKSAEEKLIGGDKDDHGCLIGAGYSWCGSLQKCIRPWEEECP